MLPTFKIRIFLTFVVHTCVFAQRWQEWNWMFLYFCLTVQLFFFSEVLISSFFINARLTFLKGWVFKLKFTELRLGSKEYWVIWGDGDSTPHKTRPSPIWEIQSPPTRLKSKVFSLGSWDIADMDKCPQDKCYLVTCCGDSCNLLNMFQGPIV